MKRASTFILAALMACLLALPAHAATYYPISVDSWLNTLSSLISESIWLAPVLALLAGVLTSFKVAHGCRYPAYGILYVLFGFLGGTAYVYLR